jgi:hypothetical protein
MTDTTPSRPDDPVPVALALLDRHWPDGPPLAEAAGSDTVAALERDSRYVIGRLQQALTALLAADLPPMDYQTSLLSQAITDAIAWRQHNGRPCPAAQSLYATRATPTGTRPTATTPSPAPSATSDPCQPPAGPMTSKHSRPATATSAVARLRQPAQRRPRSRNSVIVDGRPQR